jgi:hypothetical protein
MLVMPPLETTRLLIRPFVLEDLQDVYHLLDVELAEAHLGTDKYETSRRTRCPSHPGCRWWE